MVLLPNFLDIHRYTIFALKTSQKYPKLLADSTSNYSEPLTKAHHLGGRVDQRLPPQLGCRYQIQVNLDGAAGRYQPPNMD